MCLLNINYFRCTYVHEMYALNAHVKRLRHKQTVSWGKHDEMIPFLEIYFYVFFSSGFIRSFFGNIKLLLLIIVHIYYIIPKWQLQADGK